MHDIGAIVVCTSLSTENPEGLILGEDYEVKGRSSHEGNLVYALEDSEGKMFYSTDHFKTVKGGKKSMVEEAKVFEVAIVGDASHQKLEVRMGEVYGALGIKPEDVFGEIEMDVIEALVMKSIMKLAEKFGSR